MKPGTWLRRYWFLWLVMGLAGSTLLLRGLVKAYLAEPAARALFWLRLRYLSIPQDALWLMFLVVALYLFTASLHRPLNLQPIQWEDDTIGAERPLKRLARWVERGESAYARYRLCQVVSEMAVRQLAASLDRSVHQVKNEILQGRLELPEAVASYLQEGLKLDRNKIEAGWTPLPAVPGKADALRLDPRLLATLEYLENEANI
jgi:hypothetical protein